ncbi:hypothetical protein NVV43_28700, partial [Escherichia marmotae]|nr:hypothetical protein [Escherichia marmotae]
DETVLGEYDAGSRPASHCREALTEDSRKIGGDSPLHDDADVAVTGEVSAARGVGHCDRVSTDQVRKAVSCCFTLRRRGDRVG